MMKIAILEDEAAEASLLNGLLLAYGKRAGIELEVSLFSEAQDFIDRFDESLAVVFLDICMPETTGMEVARILRGRGANVRIVFVTNMLQYALEGYSVQAMDFIVKPVTEGSIERVMDRVVASEREKRENTIVVSDSANGRSVVLKTEDIVYAEVYRHKLTLHTQTGLIATWGSLDALAKRLPAKDFARPHVSYLVNLAYVSDTGRDTVTVGTEILPLARSQKKAFYARLAVYLGER